MLYIAATPIGNLDDITRRTLDILCSAGLIFCEDTRMTRRLADAYGLKARLLRYNEHSGKSLDEAMRLLHETEVAVLVSDSGTPCISDPGWKLVARARSEGIKIVSMPGPCAAVTALAGAGLGGGGFVFLGFLPKRKSRAVTAVRNALALEKPVIIYESPFQIAGLLRLLSENIEPDTQAVLARELTKIHEEWLSGTLARITAEITGRDRVKGEIVLILRAPAEADTQTNENTDP
ncbi:MAG: 16S rRNA (cytidine(1402)-2'-O)-methyltransferase [Elusimicrobiaceae bacterium]|nr:16S rRNA (cytidine(1402)-2'-O)-methyltransferase [Elusimicrobiaceae bacterium]